MSLKDLFFDQYQRYKVVSSIIDLYIKTTDKKDLSVLDVGGAGQDRYGNLFLPLEKFSPQIDLKVLDMMEGYDNFNNYIKGSGTSIPFEDNKYDIVVTNDTLEHVPEHERESFINELLRVTNKYVILTAPFYSEENYMAENILNEFIINVVKEDNFMLKEHIKNGLPKVKDIEKLLNDKGLKYFWFSSGNIYKWLLMNIIKHFVATIPNTFDLHLLIDKLYNEKIFETDKADVNGYRNVMIISKNSGSEEEFFKAIIDEFGYAKASSDKEVMTATISLIKTLIDSKLTQKDYINSIDIETKPTRPLEKVFNEKKFTFDYSCDIDNLSGISFIIGTYNKSLTGTLKVTLVNKKNNVEEAIQYANLRSMIDNHWAEVRFQPIPNSKNMDFEIIIECQNDFENGFSLFVGESGKPCLKILYRDFEIYTKLKIFERTIDDLQKKTNEKQNEIILLQQEVIKKQNENSEIKELLKEYDNKLIEKESEVESVRNQLAGKQNEFETIKNRAERLQNELSVIYNSNGWRWLLRVYKIRDRILGNKLLRKLLRRNNGSASIASSGNIVHNTAAPAKDPYQIWIEKNKITEEQLEKQRNFKFNDEPLISVIVPTYNTPKKFLIDVIESVVKQTYSNWELCIADGASETEYIKDIISEYQKKYSNIKFKQLKDNKGIAENSNEALLMASGEFIALLDHDDILSLNALFEVVKVINDDKKVDFIYSDEDKISEDGSKRFDPHFKPDWSPDTLRSYNYICHLTVIRKILLDEVGFFREGYNGSQDYDLFLRATEKANSVRHIPKILYHWRVNEKSVALDPKAKMYCYDSAKKALREHLNRKNLEGTVEDGLFLSSYKIKYKISDNPLISIIIPNKDHIDDLDRCIKSIFSKSSYKNYEIIIVENNSTESTTFDYYNVLKAKHSNIKVINWTNGFNYSAINNFAAKQAKGDYFLLLNNDTEIINSDWLERMLEHAMRSEVGAVGAKLYYPDNTLQHGGVILGIGGVAGHSHKYFYKEDLGYMGRLKIVQNLSCVTAACLMLRRDVFEEVGGLDEKFKVAFNDVDFCLKIRDTGKLIVWTPFAELCHYESKSRGYEDTPEKQERFRGEIEFFHKKWSQTVKKGDPYYNPNFTLISEDFSLKLD